MEDYQKRALFQKLYDALNRNGIFLNADQVRSEDSYVEWLNKTKWKSSIENIGLSSEEICSTLDRVKLDRESTLNEQLSWLKEAGFRDADCIYKYYHFAVFFARKY